MEDVKPRPRRKLSLKHLKRRFSLTLKRREGSVEESLSELADHLTIDENGGIKENGSLFQYFKADNSTGSTTSHPHGEIQDDDSPEKADLSEEKFGDEDPDEPWPNEP